MLKQILKPKKWNYLSMQMVRDSEQQIWANTIIVLATVFFLLKFNWQYKYYDQNYLLIPCFFLQMVAYTFMYRKKFTRISSYLFVVTGTIILGILLYASGGIEAPGIFWLGFIPLFYTTYFGKRGGQFSIIVIASMVGFYIWAEANLDVPNIVRDRGVYFLEKKINLVAFIIVMILYMKSHRDSYEKTTQMITNKNEEVGNLLRILIHDIANPVAYLSVKTKTLRKKLGNKNEIEDLDKMNDAIERIRDQISHVREFQSISEGKKRIELQSVDVFKITQKVVAFLDDRIREKNLKINYDLSGENTFILGNEIAFENQILINLISNAIKFSPIGGVIRITTVNRGDFVDYIIQDFGIGMPQSLIEQLFDIDKVTTRVGTSGEKGTGYGMPLVKTYVDLFSGSIKIESIDKESGNTQHGTIITLTFINSQQKKASA